jgi:hypothetical protein
MAPLTSIPPPAENACKLTPDPEPEELSVIAIKVIAFLEPLVFVRVKVGVKLAPVILNVNADV